MVTEIMATRIMATGIMATGMNDQTLEKRQAMTRPDTPHQKRYTSSFKFVQWRMISRGLLDIRSSHVVIAP